MSINKYVLVVATVLAVFLSFSLYAVDLDFGLYKVRATKWNTEVNLPDGTSILYIVSDLLIPDANDAKKFFEKISKNDEPVIEDSKDNKIINGKGVFQEIIKGKKNINVEVSYQIELSPKGKVNIRYEFINKGDEILSQPDVVIKANYDLLKNQEWKVEKSGNEEQTGKWPEEIVNGVVTLGAEDELQIITATLNTTLNKPIVYKLSADSHVRLSGGGWQTLSNFSYFAGTWKKWDWKNFPKNESCVIEVEIDLPVSSGKIK